MKNTTFQKVVDWRVKNKFLKDQILNLEKLRSFPIIEIAIFLMNCPTASGGASVIPAKAGIQAGSPIKSGMTQDKHRSRTLKKSVD